jgi:hypothetical protein
MSQEKTKLDSEATNKEKTSEDCDYGPHSCYCRINKEYEKSTKVRSLTHLIGLINFMPPFDGPISYGPLKKFGTLRSKLER